MGVSRLHVKDALLRVLDARFGWALEQAERAHDLQVGGLLRPQGPAVGRTTLDDDVWGLTPYLVASVAATSAQPAQHGERWTYTWRAGVACVVQDVDYDATSDMASVYALALRECVMADPSLGGLSIGCLPVLERYDVLGSEAARTLASAEAVFDVPVHAALNLAELPPAPPAAGDPPYLEPTIESVSVDAHPVPTGALP